jgi:hypothetical protein
MLRYARLKPFLLSFFGMCTLLANATLENNWSADTARINALAKKAADLRYKETQLSIRTSYDALEQSKKINYKMGIAKASYELAKAYFIIDDFKNSFEHARRAIDICEKEKDDLLLSAAYLALANIYVMQLNHREAVIYLNKSLAIKKKLGDREGETNIYNNTGFSYYKHKNYDSSLVWFRKSLALGTSIGYKRGMCNTLQNIGHVYNDQNMFDSALFYYNSSLPVSIELADLPLIAQNYLKISGIYFKQGNFEKMGENLHMGLNYVEKMGLSELLCNYYKELSLLYEHKNDKAKAYEFAKKYYTFSDSLNQAENSKRVNEAQFTYEIQRKTHEQQLKDQKKTAEYNAGLSRRNTIVYAAIAGLVLVVFFALFVLRSLRITKRQKNLIEKQKEEVEHAHALITDQKIQLEEKQKEILDSIYYARRIQRSLLPSEKYISKKLDSGLKN